MSEVTVNVCVQIIEDFHSPSTAPLMEEVRAIRDILEKVSLIDYDSNMANREKSHPNPGTWSDT